MNQELYGCIDGGMGNLMTTQGEMRLNRIRLSPFKPRLETKLEPICTCDYGTSQCNEYDQ